jgi:hypothetical protein
VESETCRFRKKTHNKKRRLTSGIFPTFNYCILLEEGEKILDDELVKKFPHNPRDILRGWYKLGKHFKTMNEYPTTALKLSY